MSILDSEQEIRVKCELTCNKEKLITFLFRGIGAHGLEFDEDHFLQRLEERALQENRRVYKIDCKRLRKYDAIGWLRFISQQVVSMPRSILIIENITDIPEEDLNHDNPQHVRNLLLHSWKDDVSYFTDNRPRMHNEQFTIKPHDYLILLTWKPEQRDILNLIWNPSDGYAWIGSITEFSKEFK